MKLLSGITVVDVSEGAQGPFAASLLGDLGAQVWKVERPGGEFMRRVGPFRGGDALPILHTCHSRCLCVELDLKDSTDRDTLWHMLEEADVFIENWIPGTADRLGLGVGDMELAGRSELVYVSGSGYGPTGPLASMGSLDQLGQAASGMWRLSGSASSDGERFRGALLDFVSAFITCEAALVGLSQRPFKQGMRPIHVEVSQFAAGLAVTEAEALLEQIEAGIHPSGSRSRHFAPSGVYMTLDEKWVALDITTPSQWEAFKGRAGAADLSHCTFATNRDRMMNQGRLDALIRRVVAAHSTDYWISVSEYFPVCVVEYPANEPIWPTSGTFSQILEVIQHPDGGPVVRPLASWAVDGELPSPGPLGPKLGRDNGRVRELFGSRGGPK